MLVRNLKCMIDGWVEIINGEHKAYIGKLYSCYGMRTNSKSKIILPPLENNKIVKLLQYTNIFTYALNTHAMRDLGRSVKTTYGGKSERP